MACAVIKNRLKYNICKNVKIAITVKTIYNKSELRFKSSGNIVFVFFNKNYHKLILTDSKNVMNYAEKPEKAKNKLLELHSSCKSGKPYFVHKFSIGFILKFEIFLATFNQIHNLIFFVARNKVIVIINITFEKAVIIAKKQKQ